LGLSRLSDNEIVMVDEMKEICGYQYIDDWVDLFNETTAKMCSDLCNPPFITDNDFYGYMWGNLGPEEEYRFRRVRWSVDPVLPPLSYMWGKM
jgi:hypothetical protein